MFGAILHLPICLLKSPGDRFFVTAGLRLCPGYFDRDAQEAVLAALREVMRVAPIYTPRMPNSGKPMSVRMTNCGPLGWVTDERGYRYQPTHPVTGITDAIQVIDCPGLQHLAVILAQHLTEPDDRAHWSAKVM